MIGRVVDWWTRRRQREELERKVVVERTAVERGVSELASELRRYRGQERRRGGPDRRRSGDGDRRSG